jgi:hypothetical protein
MFEAVAKRGSERWWSIELTEIESQDMSEGSEDLLEGGFSRKYRNGLWRQISQ